LSSHRCTIIYLQNWLIENENLKQWDPEFYIRNHLEGMKAESKDHTAREPGGVSSPHSTRKVNGRDMNSPNGVRGDYRPNTILVFIMGVRERLIGQ